MCFDWEDCVRDGVAVAVEPFPTYITSCLPYLRLYYFLLIYGTSWYRTIPACFHCVWYLVLFYAVYVLCCTRTHSSLTAGESRLNRVLLSLVKCDFGRTSTSATAISECFGPTAWRAEHCTVCMPITVALWHASVTTQPVQLRCPDRRKCTGQLIGVVAVTLLSCCRWSASFPENVS